MVSLHSPKQNVTGAERSLFPYYAGYSPNFVKDVLKNLELKAGARVLDPWVGSGTTAQVAKSLGYEAFGYDLNPALVIVSKARILGAETEPSLETMAQGIIERAGQARKTLILRDDALESWFGDSSSRSFRSIEGEIHSSLVNKNEYLSLSTKKNLAEVSSLAAFFYVALFRTIRKLADNLKTSNPTWTKQPEEDARTYKSWEAIGQTFLDQVKEMSPLLLGAAHKGSPGEAAQIILGSSSNLDLSSKVEAIVTSPPYCTRIDYVVATLPELAALRIGGTEQIKKLRDGMIGTPTIQGIKVEKSSLWGATCTEFLDNVAKHPSKASDGYYLKCFKQYFASTFASLASADSVLVAEGRAVFVVQDSFYKDIHNDLPTIFTEMAENIGWKFEDRADFKAKNTLAGINTRSKKYRKSAQATEAALFFRKQ